MDNDANAQGTLESVAIAADRPARVADDVANAFLEACLLDVAAIKPGNVGFHRADRGMQAVDLVRSARVAATVIARPGLRVTERIHSTLGAVRGAIGAHPNAGVVLLCAPLAHAALSVEPGQGTDAFANNVSHTLERLNLPGGTVAWAGSREAVLAELVGAHYASHYVDVRGMGLQRLAQARARGRDWRWAVTEVFLAFLAARTDGYIARRHGDAVAREVSGEALDFDRMAARATDLQKLQIELVDWDRRLKARRINPRHSADLTVATVLWSLLMGVTASA